MKRRPAAIACCTCAHVSQGDASSGVRDGEGGEGEGGRGWARSVRGRSPVRLGGRGSWRARLVAGEARGGHRGSASRAGCAKMCAARRDRASASDLFGAVVGLRLVEGVDGREGSH